MKPVVLITGASGELGAALCKALLPNYLVVATYHQRIPSIPSQLQWPLESSADYSSNKVWCVKVDLTDGRDVSRLVEICLAKHGRIDALINSAADTKYHGRLVDLHFDTQTASQQLAINSVAPFSLVSAIFHESWKHERNDNEHYNRNVINLSSFSATYVGETRGQAFYGASKAALNLLTLHLAAELAPYAVRVNAVCPSRFPDTICTGAVVGAISEVLTGSQTGEIVELTRQKSTAASSPTISS